MIVSVKVHPRSREMRFLWKNNMLHAYLTEPARDNRANKQLVRELSKRFSSCKLVKGAGSKNKLIELPIKSKQDLKAFLA